MKSIIYSNISKVTNKLLYEKQFVFQQANSKEHAIIADQIV